MRKQILNNGMILVLTFVLVPVLCYTLVDFPRRSIIKEVISMLSIMAFFIMLMQFFLSRAGSYFLQGQSMGRIIKWHKVLGYIFICVLMLHPFLIVFPRYFESGVTPQEAFITLITTANLGVVLGMVAWLLMFILGLTSLIRTKLGMRYRTWRLLHGILSIAFISVAAFHVVLLGRHMHQSMIWLITSSSIIGVSLLLSIYVFKPSKK